jgi:hypothetical protein
VSLTLNPWHDFTGLFIAGRWCSGSTGKRLCDHSPYHGTLLSEISLADDHDLGPAYLAVADSALPATYRQPFVVHRPPINTTPSERPMAQTCVPERITRAIAQNQKHINFIM